MEIITQGLVTLVLMVATYFLGLKKNTSDIKSVDVKTDIDEVELNSKVIDFYKAQTQQILIEFNNLSVEFKTVKKRVSDLEKKSCIFEECKNRVTLEDQKM